MTAPAGRTQDDRVVLRQVERREHGAVARCRAAARCARKNGTSAPIVAASSASSSRVERLGRSSFASRSAAAASELPPPSPAATGIAFVDLDAPRAARRPRPPRAPSSAAVDDRVAVETRTRRAARPRRTAIAVGERDRAAAPSRPRACRRRAAGPTTSARLIFAGAASRAHREQPRSSTNDGRRERLGPHRRVEPELGERGDGLPRASRLPRAGASSRASCDGGRTRPRRPAGCPAKSSGSAMRRNATSAESTLGGGRKTVRETGWKPVRAGGELDQHRDGAVRLRRRGRRRSGRRPRAAPSRTRARSSGGRRGSRRRSGWRRCTGRFATSFVGAGSRLREIEPERVAPVERDVRRARRGRGGAARADGRARRRERGRTARRGRASGRRGPGRSRARHRPASSSARRAMTPRMLSSARKCWPSDFFGGGPLTAPGDRRPRSRFGRSAARAPRPPRPAPRPATASVWRTLAGSLRLPRSGCGARYGLSVSARILSAGHRRGRLAKLRRLRVRHVPGERDVVAPLDRRLEQAGRREAVEDDGARERRRGRPPCPRRRRGCGSRPAGPPPTASSSWRSKSARCAVRAARGRGSSRARSPRPRRPRGCSTQLDELVESRGLGAARLMRIDPERREDALLGFGDRERGMTGRDPRADRDDARDADRTGPLDEERGGLVAPVEVGVRVDHARSVAVTPRAARDGGRAAGRPRSRPSRR